MSGVTRRDWLKLTGCGAVVAKLVSLAPRVSAQDEGMVEVPAGKALIGTTEEQAQALAQEHGYHVTWLSGEYPQREVDVAAFLIDKYPVTNAQYLEFCKATEHRRPMHWRRGDPPEELLSHPVVSVGRGDAKAYCEWVGKRLPTEVEWEKAARGEEGLVFPWGNDFDPEALQWNPDKVPGFRTAPVDAHPKGVSPYGVMDMCGNAAEWCADPPPPHGGIRGGCYMTSEVINLRAAGRNMSGFDNNPMNFYTFRCVKEVG